MRFLTVAIALGLSCTGDPLDESCGGEGVTNCFPYEYTVMRGATVEPNALAIDVPGTQLQVRVTFDKCERAPRPHAVAVRMLLPGRDEMGTDARLIDLFQLRDDGITNGDPVAQDGVIEATVDNPFFGSPEIPPNADVLLRFQARSPADCTGGMCIGGTCVSEDLEIPYRTGSRTN